MGEANRYSAEVWHTAAAQRLAVMRNLTWEQICEKRELAFSNGSVELRNVKVEA